MTAIDCLEHVARIGGRLAAGQLGKLIVELPPDCPKEFKDNLRQHKLILLQLLARSFTIVRSDILGCTLYLVPDEATRLALVCAGADLGKVYTRLELSRLTTLPLDVAVLSCQAKQTFSGRVHGKQ